MLNCTDLACVLHHHHFYAHLHHLKHHLQDDIENTANEYRSDVNGQNSDDIQGLLNDTDAPNDVVYMVCGVIIAMLMVAVIIVLVAVTINKLRKREESSVSPISVDTPQPAQILPADNIPNAPVIYRQNSSNVWVFPPLPPQPNIYNTVSSQVTLIQTNEKAGFKAFRKQFSGRFKRLVAKKSPEPAPIIPPELKPQLKTIYVY